MRIKILSDSTCDLPKEYLEKYDITLIPLTVVKNDVSFKDGVDIGPADIFAHVAAGGALCSTSAGSVGEYEEFFEKYAPEYDAVILVSLGSGFSSSYQNATVAAEEYDNVYCVDSQNLCVGQGLVVLKAAQLAQEGMAPQDILKELEALIPRVEISFVLEHLDYMVKGGRCSAATALGANLLNLKPCIEVQNGKLVVVKKYRGSYQKCLTAYARDRLEGREDLAGGQLFLLHTPVEEEALEAVRSIAASNSAFDTIVEGSAGCTISCHCGPGTLGMVYLRK